MEPPVEVFVLSPEAHMAHTAILERIRLLIPAKLDGHYESIRRGFEEGDLTAPGLSISEMELALGDFGIHQLSSK
jgi:hypothetical protein